MLRAPSWITSATSTTGSTSRASISSVTIGRPVSALASASSRRPSCPRPWNEYGRGARLVGAAAEQARAAGGDRRARSSSVWSRDSTVHGPAISEKCSPPMRRPSISMTVRSLALELGGGELERLEDRDDLLDAVVALEAEARDVLAVADRADHRHLLPREGWARAPQDSIRAMTACTCSSVAVGFITIIMVLLFSWNQYETMGDCRWGGARPEGPMPDGGGCGPRRPSA